MSTIDAPRPGISCGCIEATIAVVLAQTAGRRDHSVAARPSWREDEKILACCWMAWAGFAEMG